jgi:hypothetical protein
MATAALPEWDHPLRICLRPEAVPSFDPALQRECFVLGLRLAKAGADLPDWLRAAPAWARDAAVSGMEAWRDRR